MKKLRQYLVPLAFLTPALVMFSVYVVYPIIQSLRLSLYRWDGLPGSAQEFVGLENYVELVTDPVFRTSLLNNLLWVVFFMLAPVIGLAIALFLNQTGFGMRLIKSLFFFPFVVSQVVVGLVFAWFYNPANGLLPMILSHFGVSGYAPLSDETYVTLFIIAAGLWPQIAYCMILYLTGLNGVNPGLLEAASLDGCTGWRKLWYVVLPQLRPATFIAVVVTIIGSLRSFDLVSIMTNGGPHNSSSVLAYFMYDRAINDQRLGYGAAIATVLFLIMGVYITYFLTRMLQQERGMSGR